MAKSTAQPQLPIEVLAEFLHALERTIQPYDQIAAVLRGSTLMTHWFGDAARPAGDIDLEWLPQPDRRGRLETLLEHARRLCMCAVTDHHSSPIEFDENVPVPNDGVNLWLWDYNTPGVRCFTGWRWAERGLSGVLQIDIAQAGAYDLAGVAPEPIEMPRAGGDPARPLAYSPEMLLAAKLSWIARQVQLNTNTFLGESKDLFDAHLLLTKGHLRPSVFQNALLAAAMEDKLDWNHLDVLFHDDFELADHGFPGWLDFSRRHEGLTPQSPAEMLRTVIARLRPLLSDLPQHLPFLRSIQADPVDEANLLIYADWLEERADPRAAFLRLFCRFYFDEDRAARAPLMSSLGAQPGGWLYYVFGSPERSRDLRQRIASE